MQNEAKAKMKGQNDDSGQASQQKASSDTAQSDNSTARPEATPICGRFYNSSQAVVIANGIAVALADGMTLDEQNIWGNLFTLIGASLLSIAAMNSSNQALAEKIAAAREKAGSQSSASEQSASFGEDNQEGCHTAAAKVTPSPP